MNGRAERTMVALAVATTVLLPLNAVLTVGRISLLDHALLVGSSLALLAVRRAPRTVLLFTMLCALSYHLRVRPDVTSALPVLVAVYFTVLRGHKLLAIGAAVPLLTGSVAYNLRAAQEPDVLRVVQQGFLPAGWFVAAILMAEATRQHRAYLHQVEQRALDAERTREETALRRAGEERLRIARELHDSLTHSISVIKVQAGVAVHLARKRGEDVPAALLAIQEASGDAMRELRATLEVLREGSGLNRLPELVERARSAGLPATLTVDGPPQPLPEAVDRAAYRIVQEALTNISRHAGATSAAIRILYGQRELTVQVDDDGSADPAVPPTPGVGLTGMRERVAALGGTLCAEPRPQGGFTVRAELPVDGGTGS